MEEKVTGVMIYYYFVCKRKLWYFCHEIRMEAENEDVLLGKLLDESSYGKNEKHINIDNVFNIDFIRDQKELHEVKKSRSMEEAGIWQIKYYLYYLQKRGVENLKGKVDYPLLKEVRTIELTEEDCIRLEAILLDVAEIRGRSCPPSVEQQKICKRCSYFDLCFI